MRPAPPRTSFGSDDFSTRSSNAGAEHERIRARLLLAYRRIPLSPEVFDRFVKVTHQPSEWVPRGTVA